MKRKVIFLAALVSAASAQFAHAADGTINFVGKVESQTCTIAVGAAGIVTLATAVTGDLASLNQVAHPTDFTISLTNCLSSLPATGLHAGAKVAFSGLTSAGGRLPNTSPQGTAATSVDLQLLNSDNSLIEVGDGGASTPTFIPLLDEGYILPYKVQYFATGQSTVGAVTSSVEFDIIYN